MSNIKILHPEVPYDEEFSAVWPYRETFFGEKINNSAKCPTISHSNFRRSGSRECFEGLVSVLADPQGGRLTHAQMEDQLTVWTTRPSASACGPSSTPRH